MAGVTVLALATVGGMDVWLADEHARTRLARQWSEVGETLNRSNFPLTDTVLGQLRGLSGAEFQVVDDLGHRVAATTFLNSRSVDTETSESSEEMRSVVIGDTAFLHTAIPLQRLTDDGRRLTLHAYYPETRYRLRWREAVIPPLIVGMTTVAVVVVVSSWLALRVTRPVAELRDHVDRFARGEYVPVPLQRRDDEMRDLGVAFNQLAQRLEQYERQVRRQEQLTTLDKLAGGMAHQLRNAVTGCRMAIDFHRRDCPSDDESLAIAVQQLEAMEEYVRRFLALGRRSHGEQQNVEWRRVVEGVLPLVQPRMRHLHVSLVWRPADEPLWIVADPDELSQAIINLLLNATEAAAEVSSGLASGTLDEGRSPDDGSPSHGAPGGGGAEEHGNRQSAGEVFVELRRWGNHGRLRIEDNGAGPPAEVVRRLFEPLVSSKPDGVGLGLAIAREVVTRHQGTLNWQRQGDRTEFMIELPLRPTPGSPRDPERDSPLASPPEASPETLPDSSLGSRPGSPPEFSIHGEEPAHGANAGGGR